MNLRKGWLLGLAIGPTAASGSNTTLIAVLPLPTTVPRTSSKVSARGPVSSTAATTKFRSTPSRGPHSLLLPLIMVVSRPWRFDSELRGGVGIDALRMDDMDVLPDFLILGRKTYDYKVLDQSFARFFPLPKDDQHILGFEYAHPTESDLVSIVHAGRGELRRAMRTLRNTTDLRSEDTHVSKPTSNVISSSSSKQPTPIEINDIRQDLLSRRDQYEITETYLKDNKVRVKNEMVASDDDDGDDTQNVISSDSDWGKVWTKECFEGSEEEWAVKTTKKKGAASAAGSGADEIDSKPKPKPKRKPKAKKGSYDDAMDEDEDGGRPKPKLKTSASAMKNDDDDMMDVDDENRPRPEPKPKKEVDVEAEAELPKRRRRAQGTTFVCIERLSQTLLADLKNNKNKSRRHFSKTSPT
ncbi:hypothetical protein BYT27DRAFT_7210813 [Phlegmacium glaucopus]|nr:hypothetical protein BYT27DRAFT_7210813 [Phlegmacium glaucopus]